MIKELKIMLGIDEKDVSIDNKLNLLISNATKRLKMLLGGIEPPAEMQYIIIEVAIMRFNRLGSEGLSSHNVEGESLSFIDDDFAPFSDDIQAFLDTQKVGSRGKVRFIWDLINLYICNTSQLEIMM